MRRMISYPNPPAGHTHDLVRRDTANERFYEMVVSHIANSSRSCSGGPRSSLAPRRSVRRRRPERHRSHETDDRFFPCHQYRLAVLGAVRLPSRGTGRVRRRRSLHTSYDALGLWGGCPAPAPGKFTPDPHIACPTGASGSRAPCCGVRGAPRVRDAWRAREFAARRFAPLRPRGQSFRRLETTIKRTIPLQLFRKNASLFPELERYGSRPSDYAAPPGVGEPNVLGGLSPLSPSCALAWLCARTTEPSGR